MSSDLKQTFRTYAESQARRVLTQLDRDPDSPTHGCFDRNYWHYKIRDFPSSILQQGIFLLEALRRGDVSLGAEAEPAQRWAVGAVNALSRQARSGAVDEYFPGEQSFPAAAFGLYAVGNVLNVWKAETPEALERVEWKGLRRLAAHLARRREPEAANQYAASVAGLALAARLPELRVSGEQVQEHATRLFSLQHEEGWFPEYGGPDFGYLTVTLDALADYHDTTGDARAATAANRAIDFLAALVGADGRLPSTLNSRNTDYVVPYGLVRWAAGNPTAAWLVETLFSDLGAVGHPIWATDDRYHLHYIYASIVRGLAHLDEMIEPVAPPSVQHRWFPGCGYSIHWGDGRAYTVFIGARKGGLVRVHTATGEAAVDHGWRVSKGKRIWTNNWWRDSWEIAPHENEIAIRGPMQACLFHANTSLRHMVLRVLARLFGRRLTPLLKKVLIFRPGGNTGPRFERKITFSGDGFVIEDSIGSVPGAYAVPSPRQNPRHVASADSFHIEEFARPLLGEEPLNLDADARRLTWWRYTPDPGGNTDPE